MPETKKCPDCDAEVGSSEVTCPKCGLDFEVINDETITNFDRLQRIAAKRNKPAPVADPAPVAPKKKESMLRSLGKRKN